MTQKLPCEVSIATAEMYKSGMTLSEIGDVFGISGVAVMKRLKSAGVDRRKSGLERHPGSIRMANLRASGVVFRLIGDAYRVSAATIFNRLRHHQFDRDAWAALMPFTEDEDDLIHESFFRSLLNFPDIIDVVKDHRRLMDQEAKAVEKAKDEREACQLKDHRQTP